jgi:hypothetical protein
MKKTTKSTTGADKVRAGNKALFAGLSSTDSKALKARNAYRASCGLAPVTSLHHYANGGK